MSLNENKVDDLEDNIRKLIKNSLYNSEFEINSENIIEEVEEPNNQQNSKKSEIPKSVNILLYSKNYEKINEFKKDLNPDKGNSIDENCSLDDDNKNLKNDVELVTELSMKGKPSTLQKQKEINKEIHKEKISYKKKNKDNKNFFNFQNEKYLNELTLSKKKMQLDNNSQETPFFQKNEVPNCENHNLIKENTKEKTSIENAKRQDELSDKNKSFNKKIFDEKFNSYAKTDSNLSNGKNNTDLKQLIINKNHSLQNKIMEKYLSNKNSEENFSNDFKNNKLKRSNFEVISTSNSTNINTERLRKYPNNKDIDIFNNLEQKGKKIEEQILSNKQKRYYITHRNKNLLNNNNRPNLNNCLSNSECYFERIKKSNLDKNDNDPYDQNENKHMISRSLSNFNFPKEKISNIKNFAKKKNNLSENLVNNNINSRKNTDFSNERYSNIIYNQNKTLSNVNEYINSEAFDYDLKNNISNYITFSNKNNIENEMLIYNTEKDNFNKPFIKNISPINKPNDDNDLEDFLNNFNKRNKLLGKKLNDFNKIKLELNSKNKIIFQYEKMNISLRNEIEELNQKIIENRKMNNEWLKQYEEIRIKVINQDLEKMKLKDENENLKNKLEDKLFKYEVLENKLKNMEENNIKMQNMHSQYEKNLFDMKSDYKIKEENFKKKIEDANNLLISKIKEQEKEFESNNSKNIKIIKKLENELNDNKDKIDHSNEKILSLEKSLSENKNEYTEKLSKIEKDNIDIIGQKDNIINNLERNLKNITEKANSNIIRLNEELYKLKHVNEEGGKHYEFLQTENSKLEEIYKMEYERNKNLEEELYNLKCLLEKFKQDNNLNENLSIKNINSNNNKKLINNCLINTSNKISEIEPNDILNYTDKYQFYSPGDFPNDTNKFLDPEITNNYQENINIDLSVIEKLENDLVVTF